MGRGSLLVHVLDVEGDPFRALTSLAATPSVLRCEQALVPALDRPRPVRTSEDVLALHEYAAAPAFAARVTPPESLPPGFRGRTARGALLYPVRPGHGAAVQQVLSGGRELPVKADRTTALASTTVFRRDDEVIRLVEVAGDLDVGYAHVRATASRSPSTAQLVALLQAGFDLRTPEGFDAFLRECSLPVITDQRIEDRGGTPR